MMTAKFNSIFRAVAVAAALTLALPVFAQGSRTRVNIPMAFEMGQHSMPAGQYLFERQLSGAPLYVTDPSGVMRAFMTIPTGSSQTPFEGKLVFEKMGGTYRLAEIHITGAPSGMQIQATKAQIELAKRQKPVRIEVALARK